MNETQLKPSIENFRQQLNISFSIVESAYQLYVSASHENETVENFDDFYHDWAQSNWELLVERVICSSLESLSVYGSGSDYELATHSRVFFHSLQPTHEVICVSQNKAIDSIEGECIDLTLYSFEGFVTMRKGWFHISPPFDHVLLSEKGVYGSAYRQAVIPLEQIEFTIKNL